VPGKITAFFFNVKNHALSRVLNSIDGRIIWDLVMLVLQMKKIKQLRTRQFT
jgi:hypothetical protein